MSLLEAAKRVIEAHKADWDSEGYDENFQSAIDDLEAAVQSVVVVPLKGAAPPEPGDLAGLPVVKPRVLIEVSGGVADYTVEGGEVEVELIDHDNDDDEFDDDNHVADDDERSYGPNRR